jgi:hypothetical protein
MAFLDNSGDILLDVVLTSVGRKRLAAGTFKPVKYAFGDQEINYGLYDSTNTNGSAYYDLNILQTPIEIAHTDASISLQTKLFTLTSANGDPQLLYLPKLKLDATGNENANSVFATGRNAFAIVADAATYDALTDATSSLNAGFIDGRSPDNASFGIRVRTPLGIDSATSNGPEGDSKTALDASLDEFAYNVILDDRFIKLVSPAGAAGAGAAGTTGGASIVPAAATSNLFSADQFLRTYPVSKANQPTLFVNGPSVTDIQGPFQGPSTPNLLATTFSVNSLNQDNMFADHKIGNVLNYASTGVQMEVIQTSMKVVSFVYGYTLTVPLEIIRKV